MNPTTTFSDGDRQVFAVMADVLIPAAEGMPSASQVGVQEAPLDRVLELQPWLAPRLQRGISSAAASGDPAAAVETINRDDPAAMSAIGLAASAAYYMQPQVRKLLGYPGQVSRPAGPEEEHDYLRDGLLQPVIDRGPIYRQAPE